MSLGDRFTDALCWLKQEFGEIVKDLDLEKNEEAFRSVCNKLNEKIKNLGTSNELQHSHTEYIDINKILNWNNLNFCLFHYNHLYQRIHENLFIEEEEYAINFDEENFYVKRKFPFQFLFHPLVYPIDVAYYNLLLSYIIDAKVESKDNELENQNQNQNQKELLNNIKFNNVKLSYGKHEEQSINQFYDSQRIHKTTYDKTIQENGKTKNKKKKKKIKY